MQINHYSADYKRFEQDFTSVYAGIEPLFSVTDDLERSMSKDKPYFILPARQSKDGRKHIFYFEVVGDEYVYKGVYRQPPHRDGRFASWEFVGKCDNY